MSAGSASVGGFVFLIPVFDDWEAAGALLARLTPLLPPEALPASVLFVDDGSPGDPPADLVPAAGAPEAARFARVDVLRLRTNLGHQRAIAVGLAHLAETARCRGVVVMDADGEDRPEDVPRLIAALGESGDRKIVFAERSKRFGPLWFTLFYHLYRALHWLLTGISVRVGNFSVIPARHLANLAGVSSLWSHYAAAVFKARIPYATLPTARGARLAGRSKLGFVALVSHGLGAIAVFGDIVGTRLLILASLLSLASLALLASTRLLPLVPGVELPAATAWSWPLAASFLFFLALGIAALFFILYARNSLTFVPLRDYRFFVEAVRPAAGDGDD